MNRALSIYLDVVRFTAACLVFISHSNRRLISDAVIPASTYGHSAVIVFFVLSGFVIAYVSETKEKSWIPYAAARMSRIYSVAIPTVLLTLLLDWVGRGLHLELYESPFDHLALRVASSLAMLNEIWFISITSLSNVPYWSICYEFWYYVFFGLVIFMPRRRAVPLCLLLALMLGPKILLLAPLWIAGVVLYRWQAIRSISLSTSYIMVALSIAGIVAFHTYDVTGRTAEFTKGLIGTTAFRELTWSKNFLSDYLLGLLVFANFAGMRQVSEAIATPLMLLERPIRFAASYTLTLYLLHQPLILFWAAVIRGDPFGRSFWWAVMVATSATILIVGFITENKRYRLTAWLKEFLTAIDGRTLTARVPRAAIKSTKT